MTNTEPTYRITSPRSRTDRAAKVLWKHLTPEGQTGLASAEAHLCDVVEYRARRVRLAMKERIDAELTEAGFGPLSWTEEKGWRR